MGALSGRRILVTGASSGIGAATARALAEHGARVALMARRTDRVARLAEEIGGVAAAGDVTDPGTVTTAVAHAATAMQGIDGVVNAAGIMRPGLVADSDPADWRAMFDVNVLGLLRVTQTVIPHLRKSGDGDIVNLSSMSGRRVPSATGGVYAATKFAVHALSEGLRLELRDAGVRVLVLAPGFVRTELFDGQDGPTADRYRERMTRTGMDPEDVAAAVVHGLAVPRRVTTVEVALLPSRRG